MGTLRTGPCFTPVELKETSRRCGSPWASEKRFKAGIKACRTCALERRGNSLYLPHWPMARRGEVLWLGSSFIPACRRTATQPSMCKIPPESTLTFVIEVLEIRNGPRSHESFQEMDLNDDWRLSRDEVKVYLRKEFERHGYPPNDTLHENMAKDIFDKEDDNKDGFISSREFTYKHDEL
ncbi:peptidyl-prolyl cis-trans isomerase FKBP14-like isoform 2-T2 [Spinachia spinachia]